MVKSIKDLISAVIPPDHAWKFILYKEWENLIGSMKRHVSIEKIDGDVLYVSVDHPTWAHELRLLSPLLQEKINALFPEKKISCIRFHYRKSLFATPIPKAFYQKKDPIPPHAHDVAFDSNEKRMLASIDDQNLQSVIAAYLTRCKVLKGSKDNEKKYR